MKKKLKACKILLCQCQALIMITIVMIIIIMTLIVSGKEGKLNCENRESGRLVILAVMLRGWILKREISIPGSSFIWITTRNGLESNFVWSKRSRWLQTHSFHPLIASLHFLCLHIWKSNHWMFLHFQNLSQTWGGRKWDARRRRRSCKIWVLHFQSSLSHLTTFSMVTQDVCLSVCNTGKKMWALEMKKKEKKEGRGQEWSKKNQEQHLFKWEWESWKGKWWWRRKEQTVKKRASLMLHNERSWVWRRRTRVFHLSLYTKYYLCNLMMRLVLLSLSLFYFISQTSILEEGEMGGEMFGGERKNNEGGKKEDDDWEKRRDREWRMDLMCINSARRKKWTLFKMMMMTVPSLPSF